MTFVAQHGVEVRSHQLGADDYESITEMVAEVRAEMSRQWPADTAAGYEDVLDDNEAALNKFMQLGEWLGYLRVPYGYLVLTK